MVSCRYTYFSPARGNIVPNSVKREGRILLSGSSQGESSVMRVRLEGHKKPHYEYALAHYEYALGGSDVYSTSDNGLVHIREWVFLRPSV